MFGVDNAIFSIAGQGVSLIELLSVICGLLCVFLAVKGKVANFWIGYLYNILLFFMFLQKHLYSSMLIQPVSLGINFFGHYRWTHPKQFEKDKKNRLKITLLSWKQRLAIGCIIALFTIGWGFILSRLHVIWADVFPMATQPYLDAFVTSFILLAQYLSAQKKLDCWGAWTVVNVMNMVLYLKAGLVFMPLVCIGYLILAFLGFTMWFRQWKRECAGAPELQ